MNPIDEFRTALSNRDIVPPGEVIADGNLHRCNAAGRNGRGDAAYVLHLDGIPAGGFENHRDGLGWENWHANVGRKISDAEKLDIRARIEARRLESEQAKARDMADTKSRATAIWEGCGRTVGDHPYLTAKGVGSHKIRVCADELRLAGMDCDGALVVPMRDAYGEVRSLQFITTIDKRFLNGPKPDGLYFSIGTLTEVVCIAEGYATGASVHEATGHAVAVAFTAGNLEDVSRTLREKFPDIRIVVCADDDYRTDGNPGTTKARRAAEAVAGTVAMPDFGADRPDGATDFNDMARHRGLAAVAEVISRAIAIGTSVPPDFWPPPHPIVAELKPVPAFDADTLLPIVLRNWVMDEAERMPCPPEFVAVAALVALGSLIGARCAIKPKSLDSWVIVPNLWGGIVGDPSAKKSPAWGAALKPLDRLIRDALDEHTAAMAEYESVKLVYDAEKDAIANSIKVAAKKKSKDDTSASARELRSHNENEPAAPVLRRYKTNDSTVEKLGELLRENPAGLLVLRDELVGLIATWEREGREGERAFFLEAWNGNQSFDTDRIGRGHIAIPNVCLSIFGGIQPDKLTTYLEQASHALANDGMLQRFQMLVYPNPREWEWRDRAPNQAARDAAHHIFERLANFNPVEWGAAPSDDVVKFPWFRFDNAAQAVFIEWSGDLHRNRMVKEEEPIMRQHLAKFDKLFPALALVFQLVDSAALDLRGPVSRDAAVRAAAWCEFLEAHARRCYGLLKDGGLRAAQALAAKLESGKLRTGFTLRDVRRNQWRNLTADDAIQAALDWLEGENWLSCEESGGTGPGGGRRTVRYRINPAVKRIHAGGGS